MGGEFYLEGSTIYDGVKSVVNSFMGVKWSQDLSHANPDFVAECLAFETEGEHRQVPVTLNRDQFMAKAAGEWSAKIALPNDILKGMEGIDWGRNMQ